MSRIGKLPIPVPDKVKVAINGNSVTVEGPKGKLTQVLPPKVSIEQKDNELHVARAGNDRISRSMHGLARSLVGNMVQGVVEPFKKSIEVTGVGYRVEINGKKLKMQVGFAHDIDYEIPVGVDAKVDKNTIVHLESVDKQLVGQVAADLRAYKPCEPYKGKGIKYVGEQIRRKEGKTGAS